MVMTSRENARGQVNRGDEGHISKEDAEEGKGLKGEGKNRGRLRGGEKHQSRLELKGGKKKKGKGKRETLKGEGLGKRLEDGPLKKKEARKKRGWRTWERLWGGEEGLAGVSVPSLGKKKLGKVFGALNRENPGEQEGSTGTAVTNQDRDRGNGFRTISPRAQC